MWNENFICEIDFHMWNWFSYVNVPFQMWNTCFVCQDFIGEILNQDILYVNWAFRMWKRSHFRRETKISYVKMFEFHTFFTFKMTWNFRKGQVANISATLPSHFSQGLRFSSSSKDHPHRYMKRNFSIARVNIFQLTSAVPDYHEKNFSSFQRTQTSFLPVLGISTQHVSM